jgi:nitrogen fixation protein FixH
MLLPLAPMAYLSVHTLPGVVTDKAYEEGIAYNKAIAAGAQEQALGWHGDIALEYAMPTSTGIILYTLTDAKGKPVGDASVHAWLVRPVQGGMDRDRDMTSQGDGRYRATFDIPARGVWDVRISATRDNVNFQSERRIVLP